MLAGSRSAIPAGRLRVGGLATARNFSSGAVEAQTWEGAISKLDCKDIKKNADGSFSITAVVKLKGEEHHNPIVNVPEYKSEIEAKKC
jgi:hypothetical protein